MQRLGERIKVPRIEIFEASEKPDRAGVPMPIGTLAAIVLRHSSNKGAARNQRRLVKNNSVRQ
jgi:hypothetical protein